MTTVAWIGLGAMGTRMARRVADAGHELTVWDRTAARTVALAERGARVAPAPSEAIGGAEVVVVTVADPDALADVAFGRHGVATTIAPPATVIEMSTVGPDAVGRLRTALPAGVAMLDAPVLGSVAEAEAGTLMMLVGGPADVLDRWRTLLAVLGDVVYVGPNGWGAAAKLIANSALLATVGALGEAIALADGLGLERDVTWRVLGHTPLAAQAERRRPVIESTAVPTRFKLALARKDAQLIVHAAEDAGVELRLAPAVHSWLADAETSGLGGHDYTTVVRHIVNRARAAAEGQA